MRGKRNDCLEEGMISDMARRMMVMRVLVKKLGPIRLLTESWSASSDVAASLSAICTTIRGTTSAYLNMALPLPPGLTPPEIAFLCEMELVTVIPRQKLEGLELLGVRVPLQYPSMRSLHLNYMYIDDSDE